MEHTPQKRSVLESVVLAISSIGIGAYCASFSSHLAMQAILMSLPPTSLLISQRRRNATVAVVDTPRHTTVEYLTGVHAA